MPRINALLLAGVAVPVIYSSTVFASALASPGYSHLTRYASELGMAEATSARWFNGGAFLTGLAVLALQ